MSHCETEGSKVTPLSAAWPSLAAFYILEIRTSELPQFSTAIKGMRT